MKQVFMFYIFVALVFICTALMLTSCAVPVLPIKGKQGDQGQAIRGPSGPRGEVGVVGPTGEQGTAGSDGHNGLNGANGLDALSPINVVNLCVGYTTYPGVFVETALCINNHLYGVYSANGGFLTLLPPGNYSSNAIGSACNLTVHDDCTVSH